MFEELAGNLKAAADLAERVALLERWPPAVEPELICDPARPGARRARARLILDSFDDGCLEGKRILDYGCGDGALIECAGAGSIRGYDPSPPPGAHHEVSSSFEHIAAGGPYDAIFLYDVLDHLQGETPLELGAKLRRLSRPGTAIFARCHPWTARHGAHLYGFLNKAFLQLAFSEDELSKLGCPASSSRRYLDPLREYRSLFPQARGAFALPEQSIFFHPWSWTRETARRGARSMKQLFSGLARSGSGFEASEHLVLEPVESYYFEHEPIRRRLLDLFGTEEDARRVMEVSYVDYVARVI